MVGAAGLSALVLAMFFAPLLVLGYLIDAALVWLVLSSAWTPGAGGGT